MCPGAAAQLTEDNVMVLRRILKLSLVRRGRPGVGEAAPLDPAHVGHVGLGHDVEAVHRLAHIRAGAASGTAPQSRHFRHGSTSARSWANHASARCRSAREIHRLERAGIIDLASLPTPPGNLGDGSGVTHAQSRGWYRDPVNLIDTSGLIFIDL